LQKFAVEDDVMTTIHFERFSLGIVRKLHARRTCSYIVPGRIAFITHELNIPWDLVISLIFSKKDSTLSDACIFLDLPPTAANTSQRPVLPPPPSFKLDA